jgi:hypothetical protein
VGRQRRPDPAAPRPYDDALVQPVDQAPVAIGKLVRKTFPGAWPWVPDFSQQTPAAQTAAAKIDARESSTQGMGLAFEGFFHAARDGDYVFHVASDSGAVLFLHQARVIDDDFGRSGGEASGDIRLAAGWHPFRLYSRHPGSNPLLEVSWQQGGGARLPLSGDIIGSPIP